MPVPSLCTEYFEIDNVSLRFIVSHLEQNCVTGAILSRVHWGASSSPGSDLDNEIVKLMPCWDEALGNLGAREYILNIKRM